MNQTAAVWLLIALALVSANLPFLSERVFALLPYKRAGVHAPKPFWLRLCEVLVWYAVVGLLGFAFEAQLGNRFAQAWEFYAITFSLFLVLGYPGFVYRYLSRSAARPGLESAAPLQRYRLHEAVFSPAPASVPRGRCRLDLPQMAWMLRDLSCHQGRIEGGGG